MPDLASQAAYICALDSGGSKTLCWLVAADGTVLARQSGMGAANIHDEEIVRGILTPILQAALAEAGLQMEQLSAINACLGGLNASTLQKALQTLAPQAKIQVTRESSGEAIFVGAPFWGFDIALMAGTGVVAVGVNQQIGLKCSCSGWGPLIHDLGGGFAIGQQALRTIAESIDFQRPQSSILPALAKVHPFKQALEQCQFLDKTSAEMSYEERLTLKNAIKNTIPLLDRRTVASLFPTVCQCAEKKDAVAIKILEQAAETLVKVTKALAFDLRLKSPRITPIGGIFRAGEVLCLPYRTALRRVLPDAELVFNDFTQIHGSVLLAMQLAGLSLSAAQVAKLRRS
jgi:N-acetylglucosamine kinase-like BadF-type ATPase